MNIICFVKSPEKQGKGQTLVLLAYASLAASESLFQLLVMCLNLNEKSNFYELWQQYKQVKTMEMMRE